MSETGHSLQQPLMSNHESAAAANNPRLLKYIAVIVTLLFLCVLITMAVSIRVLVAGQNQLSFDDIKDAVHIVNNLNISQLNSTAHDALQLLENSMGPSFCFGAGGGYGGQPTLSGPALCASISTGDSITDTCGLRLHSRSSPAQVSGLCSVL